MSILGGLARAAKNVVSRAAATISKLNVNPVSIVKPAERIATGAPKVISGSINAAPTITKTVMATPTTTVKAGVIDAVGSIIGSIKPAAASVAKVATSSAAAKVTTLAVGGLASTYAVNQAIKGYNEEVPTTKQLPAVSYNILKTGKSLGSAAGKVIESYSKQITESEVAIQNIQDVFSNPLSTKEQKLGVIQRAAKVAGEDVIYALPIVAGLGGAAYIASLGKDEKSGSIPSTSKEVIPQTSPQGIVINNYLTSPPEASPKVIPEAVAPNKAVVPTSSNIAPVTASKPKKKHKVYKKSPLYTPFMNRIYNNVNIAVRA